MCMPIACVAVEPAIPIFPLSVRMLTLVIAPLRTEYHGGRGHTMRRPSVPRMKSLADTACSTCTACASKKGVGFARAIPQSSGVYQPELREYHLHRALPQALAQVSVHPAAGEPQIRPRFQAQHHFSGQPGCNGGELLIGIVRPDGETFPSDFDHFRGVCQAKPYESC